MISTSSPSEKVIVFRRGYETHRIPFVSSADEIRRHFEFVLASLRIEGDLDFCLDPVLDESPGVVGTGSEAKKESDPFFPTSLLSGMNGSSQQWESDQERAVLIPIDHLRAPVVVDEYGKFAPIDGDYICWIKEEYRQVIAHWNLGAAFSMEQIFGPGEGGRVSSDQIYQCLKQCLPIK